jgi:hypothetical protein
MPQLTKEKLIKNFKILNQDIQSYNIFVESGTHLGETILNLKDCFGELHTIELAFVFYHYFNKIKIENNYYHIKNYFGDTVKILPEILISYTEKDKCVFWLDGHFSSGETAKGEKDVPLIEECCLIDKLYKAEYAVLFIDDFRLFGTKESQDWSDISIDNISNCFKNFEIIKKFVSDDILILLIKNIKK